jgi:DNA-binding NarL/FixJ family response regulator
MPDATSEVPVSKILILDDHPTVREALAIRTGQIPDLKVCGEAGDIEEALRLVVEQKPDLAITDLALKHGDGIDLVKRIMAMNSAVRMLVWSMHSERFYADLALRAGAHGYIPKEESTSQVVEAMRKVLAGAGHFSPPITRSSPNPVNGNGVERLRHPTVSALSDRELEVLRMIGQGMKTSKIADHLHLSIETVGTYRDRIREKLALADGRQLDRYAAH